MKESFQNRERNEEVRHEVKETGERTISRREFLKLLGAAGALLASQGFHGSASAEDVFLKKEQKETSSLVERWKQLVEAAVKDLETRPGLYWKGKEAQEVKEVLPQFDIAQFLQVLSENSGIPSEEITARLETFSIRPQDPHHLSLMGDMSPKDRSLSIYLVPPFFRDGALDQELLFSTLRHELTHALSVDYETSDKKRMIPWVAAQESFSVFISPNFYEGATELISLRASPEKKYKRNTPRAYSGGITLAAYVIARLVGEQIFTHAYLKKDPVRLARAMDEKIGQGAALSLTEPINMEASLYEKHSLDILHNILKHEYEFDLLKVKEILRDAWQEGMEELVEYKMDGGIKMTLNLFPLFDEMTGQRVFSVTAAAEGPEVTRFKKNPLQELSREGMTVSLWRHSASLVMRQTPMGQKERDENIRFAAEKLRNVLSNEDPYYYGEQSLLIIGLPREVTKELVSLNRTNTPSSLLFQNQWVRIQDTLKDYITSALKEVYEQAEVTEEQYVPQMFSPLSLAE